MAGDGGFVKEGSENRLPNCVKISTVSRHPKRPGEIRRGPGVVSIGRLLKGGLWEKAPHLP